MDIENLTLEQTREAIQKEAHCILGDNIKEMLLGLVDRIESDESELAELRSKLSEIDSELSSLPAKWSEDSSLETWFPYTKEELDHLRNENQNLRAYKEAAEKQGEIEVTKEMIYAFCNAISDARITDQEFKEVEIGLKAALCNLVLPAKPAVAVPDLNHLASTLMDAWKFAEPSHGVTANMTSYVSTFVDMARAVINQHYAAAPSHSQQSAEQLEGKYQNTCPGCRGVFMGGKHDRKCPACSNRCPSHENTSQDTPKA